MKHAWSLFATIAFVFALSACSGAGSVRAGGGTDKAFQAVVAADHELASRAGARVLREGGNAVDAAVATSLALSVVRPYSCGIGGGGFMLIAFKNDKTHGDLVTAIDYRETAPEAVDAGYYADGRRSSVRGGTSVAVPGTVAGLMYAHERYGRLPREKVVAPAIELAEKGFAADAHYADEAASLVEKFEANPGWAARFPLVWEKLLLSGTVSEGDLIRVPEQAEVLRAIARGGRDGFYTGSVASAMVHAVRKDGGDLTLEDLRRYRPIEREPVRATIAGRTFIGMPPPSSGGVTMFEAFEIMEAAGYDFDTPPDDGLAVHLLAEGFKHAFADRSRWFGDPGFVDVPVDMLLSKKYTVEQAFKIDREHTQPPESYGSVAPLPEDSGTSHFSIVDSDGNAVACTETINLGFGSLLGVDRYGFMLNDEMDDFLTRPGVPNAFGLVQSERNLPAPGKRPLSSMSPTLVFDDDGLLVTAGASGGPRIISATAQTILRVLAGASASDALAAGRMHHQWLPNRLDIEPGALPPEVLEDLERRGHVLGKRAVIGNVQVIRRAAGGWDAASDPRKGGRPAGY
jgi:gamma-glutamyltranspeptidase / glutathione hydrolase